MYIKIYGGQIKIISMKRFSLSYLGRKNIGYFNSTQGQVNEFEDYMTQ